MDELKAILVKPQVKSVVLALLTSLIGILPSIVANNTRTWYYWGMLMLIVAIYVFAIIKYAKLEKSIKDELNETEAALSNAQRSIDTFQSAFQGVNAICKLSSRQINLKIHEIIEQGKIYCDNWNFDIASTLLCEQIYNHVICHICESREYNGNVDIEVAYVSVHEHPKRKKNTAVQIKLCGYYHPSRQNPSMHRMIRNANKRGSDGRLLHDGRLFGEKRNTNSILMTKKDIDEKFGSLPPKHDYCQYIGIPVFCDTASGENKMVGLLEIVCHNNSYISSDENRIKECIDLYLSTYSSVFLLLFKNDKALRATPK